MSGGPRGARHLAPNLCLKFLVAARMVAKQAGRRTDRGFGVVDNGRDYFLVQAADGENVFEGTAHCRWCARAEALNQDAS